jgi:hypothetical protein
MLAMMQTCRKGQASTTKKEVKKLQTTFSKLGSMKEVTTQIKLFVKSGKDGTETPWLDEISKRGKKKGTLGFNRA